MNKICPENILKFFSIHRFLKLNQAWMGGKQMLFNTSIRKTNLIAVIRICILLQHHTLAYIMISYHYHKKE